MIKAVIFDMDGVIVDSEPIHFESDQLTLKHFGIEASHEELNQYVGVTNPVMWADLKRKHNLVASVEALLEKQSYYKNYLFGIKKLEPIDIKEIKNRSREEVNLLMNGAELLLLTSFSEGSPNVIKEAMACNCPIVATDVGDIADVIKNTPGCYLTSFDPADVAEKIKQALAFGKRTNGRKKIRHLDNKIIAEKIVEVYKKVL